MSHHYLKPLFSPSSIAVIGASNRLNSVGMKVFKNLLQNNFKGKLYAVNPKHHQVQGEACFASVNDIKEPIDLVVIATPAKTVPAIITDCGKKNVRVAIVLSAGFSETGKEGKSLEIAMLDAAKQNQVRIMGPNCLGIMRPHIRMNATFDNNFALPGTLALVSQSGALSSGILDWAIARKIGFSSIVSMGNNADLNFADILDYLTLDPFTHSILLYIEGIRYARTFMSALRAAARVKPVIAIKAGRNAQGSRAALSHTGALIGSDDVFDAALRRAGAVRVMQIEDLFSAAEILSSPKKITGNRLAIVTNGGGAGVMAADRAAELKLDLAPLTDAMINQLNQVLPTQWSHQNPIDIIGDASPERYHAVLDICDQDKNVDAVLTMLVPVAMAKPLKVAKQVVADAKKTKKIILACWMGEKQVKSSWKLFAKHKIPYFDTPEKAVEAFSYLADYFENQQLLLQVPAPFIQSFKPDVQAARAIIEAVLSEKRTILTAYESKKILRVFGIPATETIEAESESKAVEAAKSVGFPVVMKINSPDISHKSKIGGVCLNISTEEEVRTSFAKIMNNAKLNCPDAKIFGVTIETQYQNLFDREIMIGVMRDIVFGPVISFGGGGTLVEIYRDRALALPPLNRYIAQQLIDNTRILHLGGKLQKISAEQLDNIITILLRVSDMVCELPQIQEMDINPLILNETGMMAVDARMVVAEQAAAFVPYSHLAIHPYPNYLITTAQLPDKTTITLRPIRPEDAELEQTFVGDLSSQSKYFRFMGQFREFSPAMLSRLTQIDYDREMALVATIEKNNQEQLLGVARYATNPDKNSAEFALVVADAWHQKGIGTLLMNKLFEIAKANNLQTLVGAVFASNASMLELTQHLGFVVSDGGDASIKIVTKQL